MKSMHNNNKSVSPTPTNVRLTQRRLKTKPALTVMGILLLGNIFWFMLWIWPSGGDNQGGEEIAATIDGEKITRQQWLAEIESRYGKETLKDLVNEAVMEKAAKKYDIKVIEDEIDLEIALMRSAQDMNDTENLTEEQLRQKVRAQLILERVLAKDIIIEEEQTSTYYEENKSLYNIPTAYRTSMIVVASKADAQSVEKELASGSDFSVLARERSLDAASASLGGDIGFITEEQDTIDTAIGQAVAKLKKDETSKPIKLSDGRYALVQLLETVEGQSFAYEEVKEQIAREMAMEQLSATITPEAFWADFDVTWFYGEEKK
ncbi:peptidyl-prolyl cis-trans isomerase [Lysinibacillus sp. KU-BSD001]|uniref:peptidyl-prolyl cis-trans isomerase n=1 Tax=Lysinibacillus sp. KU-BSD001 TaxID=3141328 RepID=UPI0036E1D0AE